MFCVWPSGAYRTYSKLLVSSVDCTRRSRTGCSEHCLHVVQEFACATRKTFVSYAFSPAMKHGAVVIHHDGSRAGRVPQISGRGGQSMQKSPPLFDTQ